MAIRDGRRRNVTLAAMVALVGISGCSSTQNLSNAWRGNEEEVAEGNHFIRIHYRLQDVQESGDVTTWGVHFWNAGAIAPNWGTPQRFDQEDDFGGYTDIPVTVVGDEPDNPPQGESPWLGILPVQCTTNADNHDCRKDIEQNARFFDLTKNEDNPNIAEGWITQGQALLRKKPDPDDSLPYTIERAKDFIDFGDGAIRMMFRVPNGSNGTVERHIDSFGPNKIYNWTAEDNINRKGLRIDGLQPDLSQVYSIRCKLNDVMPCDKADNVQLTPAAFTPISQADDWASWSRSHVMYELIVRTFADGGTVRSVKNPMNDSGIDSSTKDGLGDLVGLKASLGYLKDLGVDTIVMTPIFKSRSYHGYDIEDFYGINPDFGTLKDFQALTEAAHTIGIRIVLEVVQPYVADTHPWFVKGSNPDNPEYQKYHDYFIWADGYSHMTSDNHPWDDGNFVWTCKKYQCYHQIAGISLPQLNFHNPNVREEMKNVARHWIDLGVDGFKVTGSALIDRFDDLNEIPLDWHGAHVWWKDFNAYIKSTKTASGERALLIGDNRWDNPDDMYKMIPYGGDADAQLDFPLRTIIGNFINGAAGPASPPHDFVDYSNELQQKLQNTAKGGNPNHYLIRFLSTHDFERPATQFRFAGNTLANKLKQAATIVFTLPGTPLIYYGEEFGKRGAASMFNGSYRDEFKREPMSWFQNLVFNGDNIDFLETNALNTAAGLTWGITLPQNSDFPHIKYMSSDEKASWTAQRNDDSSLLAHYKKLIAIRHGHPIFSDIQTKISVLKDESTLYAYTLENPQAKRITVALNRTSGPRQFPYGVGTDLLSGKTVNRLVVDIPAYGAVILESD